MCDGEPLDLGADLRRELTRGGPAGRRVGGRPAGYSANADVRDLSCPRGTALGNVGGHFRGGGRGWDDGGELRPFVRELNELRRGRGLDAADLHQRIGPCLRGACDITETDPPAAARQKLVLRLTELCGRLPPDLRLAALAAFGLHEEAAGEFLDRRISWLASVLDRDPRTARRRIDLAFRRLAELLGAPTSDRTCTRWPAGTSRR